MKGEGSLIPHILDMQLIFSNSGWWMKAHSQHILHTWAYKSPLNSIRPQTQWQKTTPCHVLNSCGRLSGNCFENKTILTVFYFFGDGGRHRCWRTTYLFIFKGIKRGKNGLKLELQKRETYQLLVGGGGGVGGLRAVSYEITTKKISFHTWLRESLCKDVQTDFCQIVFHPPEALWQVSFDFRNSYFDNNYGQTWFLDGILM